jgi:hypothetical protein
MEFNSVQGEGMEIISTPIKLFLQKAGDFKYYFLEFPNKRFILLELIYTSKLKYKFKYCIWLIFNTAYKIYTITIHYVASIIGHSKIVHYNLL